LPAAPGGGPPGAHAGSPMARGVMTTASAAIATANATRSIMRSGRSEKHNGVVPFGVPTSAWSRQGALSALRADHYGTAAEVMDVLRAVGLGRVDGDDQGGLLVDVGVVAD
jgi:hypothetical protein